MTDLLVSKAISPAPRRSPIGGRTTVLDLARVHGIRMVRQPVLLLGLAWYVLRMGFSLPDKPFEQYIALTGLVVLVAGLPAFFAANLVATSGHRSGTDEWTPSLPMPPVQRTFALLLACLAPAAVAAIVNLGMLAALSLDGSRMPIAWQHFASVPVTVLGGAILGVTVGRLLPLPGVSLVVAAALITFNIWTNSATEYLGLFVSFASWTETDAIPAMEPGAPTWHLVYVAALCGLAACGAFLRDARRTWIPVACGAAFGALVLVAGTLQLA
jgi:hypothetical protein